MILRGNYLVTIWIIVKSHLTIYIKLIDYVGYFVLLFSIYFDNLPCSLFKIRTNLTALNF